jgi:uncharacterized cupredoxin-like copper-binding protein
VSAPKIDLHQLQTSVAVHEFIVEQTATLCPEQSLGTAVATEGVEMKTVSIVLSISAVAFTFPALAEGDLSRADPIEIVVEMGATDAVDKPMYFKPDHIDLETGKAYKLVLKNTDEVKHEFASPGLMERSFTRKVEITDEEGNLVAEVKGNVSEIEVGPGKSVDWYIVPVQNGENLPMECLIEGHLEAGMFGTITVK